jgi:hypothetical protein
MFFPMAFSLSPMWATWLTKCDSACRFPLTKEHVIPKSLLPSRYTETKHNIIGLPGNLNHRRGVLKYVECEEEGVPVWPCRQCDNPLCPLMGRIVSDGFVPPSLYKPVIGASVLRSIMNDRDIADAVHEHVLDVGTALRWVRDGYEDLPDPVKSTFDLPGTY